MQNSFTAIVRLVEEPVLKRLGANTLVSCNSVNSQRKKTPAGDYEDNPMWIHLNAWGVIGDSLAKYHKKDVIMVSGVLSMNSYQTSNGNTLSTLDLKVNFVDHAMYKKLSDDDFPDDVNVRVDL